MHEANNIMCTMCIQYLFQTLHFNTLKLHRGIYRIRQNSRGGKLSRCSWFLLNCESFPVENFTRLGMDYYKKLLPQKFSRRIFIFALTEKVFPLNCFDVYGKLDYNSESILMSIKLTMYRFILST